MIKVLNLYAGIGGNRKLWDNVEVTAVENNEDIANIYRLNFPQDKVVIGDAHQYLLEHSREFDFIWSSPPCPTHSIMNTSYYNRPELYRYPDMTLYQEIIFLKHWFKGKFVVENVKSYYNPLIKPQICENHYFWTNFIIPKHKKINRGIDSKEITTIEQKLKRVNLRIPDYITDTLKHKVLNNCVTPEVGRDILKAAYSIKQKNLIELV